MAHAVKRSDGDPVRVAKISRKNQVTLPVAVMAAAHVRPGDLIRVEVEADGVLRLVRQEDPWRDAFDEFAGSAPGLAVVADLDGARDAWER